MQLNKDMITHDNKYPEKQKKAYDILIVMVEGNDKGMCIMNGREKRLSCGELIYRDGFLLVFFLWLGWVVVDLFGSIYLYIHFSLFGGLN